jgi:soluble P-type ATPase
LPMTTASHRCGIAIAIPGFGELRTRVVCSDYTGTLACEGKLIRGVRERLRKLARVVDIHIVTSDTRKTAIRELATLTKTGDLTLVDASPSKMDHSVFKLAYIKALGVSMAEIAVFGNGRNDVKWLKAVNDAGGLAVAVDVGEGCATDAIVNANVFVTGITNALDLLLDKQRLVGTLRTESDT